MYPDTFVARDSASGGGADGSWAAASLEPRHVPQSNRANVRIRLTPDTTLPVAVSGFGWTFRPDECSNRVF